MTREQRLDDIVRKVLRRRYPRSLKGEARRIASSGEFPPGFLTGVREAWAPPTPSSRRPHPSRRITGTA